MKMSIGTIGLDQMPAQYRNRFYEELGPEAREVIDSVSTRVKVPYEKPVEDGVKMWRQPFDLVQVVRATKDLDTQAIGDHLVELQREPHGELATDISNSMGRAPEGPS